MFKLKNLLKEEEKEFDDQTIFNHAKSRGYEHITYRGDTHADKIFSYSKKERREYGIFTTPIKQIAATYSKNRAPRKFYVRAPKILDLTQDTLENMKWIDNWSKSFDEWIDRESGEQIDAWSVLSGGGMFDYEGNWSSKRWMDIQATAKSDGYDVVILPDYDSGYGVFPSFVVFDEHNLKLAISDIPLNQRFDHRSNDIRY